MKISFNQSEVAAVVAVCRAYADIIHTVVIQLNDQMGADTVDKDSIAKLTSFRDTLETMTMESLAEELAKISGLIEETSGYKLAFENGELVIEFPTEEMMDALLAYRKIIRGMIPAVAPGVALVKSLTSVGKEITTINQEIADRTLSRIKARADAAEAAKPVAKLDDVLAAAVEKEAAAVWGTLNDYTNSPSATVLAKTVTDRLILVGVTYQQIVDMKGVMSDALNQMFPFENETRKVVEGVVKLLSGKSANAGFEAKNTLDAEVSAAVTKAVLSIVGGEDVPMGNYLALGMLVAHILSEGGYDTGDKVAQWAATYASLNSVRFLKEVAPVGTKQRQVLDYMIENFRCEEAGSDVDVEIAAALYLAIRSWTDTCVDKSVSAAELGAMRERLIRMLAQGHLSTGDHLHAWISENTGLPGYLQAVAPVGSAERDILNTLFSTFRK